nr:hypothetical protein [uncultured bacterium]
MHPYEPYLRQKSASADDLPEYWLLHYARVLQFMVELGWTKEVKAFLEKSSFDYLKTTKKRLAEWIIAFLDEEAAYALFKRCHWTIIFFAVSAMNVLFVIKIGTVALNISAGKF